MSINVRGIGKFFNEYKKEIAIGVGVVATCVLGGYCIHRVRSNMSNVVNVANLKVSAPADIPVKDLTCGTWVDKPWAEGGVVNMIVNDVKIGDLGNFGKELVDTFEGLADENLVSAVICLDNVYAAK